MTPQEMAAAIRIKEGGFVDDPVDAGGVTNYGISLNFAKSYPKFFDLNRDGKVDRADIIAMTPAIAEEAYYEFFYLAERLDFVPNLGNIQFQLFDFSVNSGNHDSNHNGVFEAQAIKTLQHVVGTTVDGELGPKTVAALKQLIAVKGVYFVNNAIVDMRNHFYDQVVAAHPQYQKFLAGWKNRSNSFRM